MTTISTIRYSTFGGTCSTYLKKIFSSIRWWIIRLLRYSISGWDTLTISQRRIFLVHKMMNYSITSILDLWMGHAPYLPKRFNHPWGDKLSTTAVLDLRTGQTPKRTLSHKRQQTVGYYNTRLNPRQDLYFTRRITHPRDGNQSISTYSTQKDPNQGSHHTRKWRPIDYYSTRQRGFIRPRDDKKPRLLRYSTNYDTRKSTTTVLIETDQDSQW
jgi:hypothetical protein